MKQKKFKLDRSQMSQIVRGMGGCLATDRIVVDGAKVGYMYREKPANPLDSGWRFFAGDEDASYMQDNAHHGVYDLNTIANYDPEVVNYLSSEVGSRFERQSDGSFRRVDQNQK